MELTPEMITLGTELATIAGRKSVQAIIDKIKTVKQKGDKDEIISNLEEIINEHQFTTIINSAPFAEQGISRPS